MPDTGSEEESSRSQVRCLGRIRGSSTNTETVFIGTMSFIGWDLTSK